MNSGRTFRQEYPVCIKKNMDEKTIVQLFFCPLKVIQTPQNGAGIA